jgi:alkanesulfonate monooxygenase SsuD/methylene tetrahydromethanopterin reductase-like flavin-dependent oxidoreductase (luciferase family)
VAELAAEAEQAGWDGFFLWDHVAYRGVDRIADPWVTLAAIATRTSRVLLGPLVTPLPRRRPHQLARETVTLDRLSGGRLVFGIGLGGGGSGEFEDDALGEETDPRARAVLLDEGLAQLRAYWDGGFEPRPVSRIPVWAAARWPKRAPLRRAAGCDGLFPIDMDEPDELAELVAHVGELRGGLEGYDIVVDFPPGTDPEPWAAAGASWCLTGFGSAPTADAVRAAIRV